MNAKAKHSELLLITADYEQRMARHRKDILNEIFAEAMRIHRTERVVTVALHPSFVSVFVHDKDCVDSCINHNADLDNAAELIDLLAKLEDITNPVYDLEEVPSDAEAVS